MYIFRTGLEISNLFQNKLFFKSLIIPDARINKSRTVSKQKLYRQAKVKRIQYHQTSFTTAHVTSLGR